MDRKEIAPKELVLRPVGAWADDWMLLTCGDFAEGRFNCMTVSWGSLGTMWDMPFAMVVVRPTRYTYEFMERTDNFALCAFPERHRDTLLMLGTKSGRDTDKVGESGLTPVASARISSPGFEEAKLILECRKIYFDDYEPDHFLDGGIHGMYDHDYHRVYFGEIVAAHGAAEYRG